MTFVSYSGSLRALYLVTALDLQSKLHISELSHGAYSGLSVSPLIHRGVEHFNEQLKNRFNQRMGGDKITTAWITQLRQAAWGLKAAVPQSGTSH